MQNAYQPEKATKLVKCHLGKGYKKRWNFHCGLGGLGPISNFSLKKSLKKATFSRDCKKVSIF